MFVRNAKQVTWKTDHVALIHPHMLELHIHVRVDGLSVAKETLRDIAVFAMTQVKVPPPPLSHVCVDAPSDVRGASLDTAAVATAHNTKTRATTLNANVDAPSDVRETSLDTAVVAVAHNTNTTLNVNVDVPSGIGETSLDTAVVVTVHNTKTRATTLNVNADAPSDVRETSLDTVISAMATSKPEGIKARGNPPLSADVEELSKDGGTLLDMYASVQNLPTSDQYPGFSYYHNLMGG